MMNKLINNEIYLYKRGLVVVIQKKSLFKPCIHRLIEDAYLEFSQILKQGVKHCSWLLEALKRNKY
jgi:hypothetical protein